MTLSTIGPIIKDSAELAKIRQGIIKASQYVPQVQAVTTETAEKPSVLAGLFKLFGNKENNKIERVDISLNERRQSSIGLSAGKLSYVSGFPQEGHGNKARHLPALQFISMKYQPIFSKIGLMSLADFLGAATVPAARAFISQATGIPRHLLLLTVLRAELLDLPTDRQPCQPVHVNDAALLSLMGINTVGQLGVMQRACVAHPLWNNLLLQLLVLVQKAHPEYMGKQRITKVEVRDWGLAAEHRGSDVLLSNDGTPESLMEESLLKLFQKREENPDDILMSAILALHLLAYQENLIREMELEDALANDLPNEYQQTFRYYRRVRLRLTAEQTAPFKEFRLDDEPHSLLFKLRPWLAPDSTGEHIICATNDYSFFPSETALPWQPTIFQPLFNL